MKNFQTKEKLKSLENYYKIYEAMHGERNDNVRCGHTVRGETDNFNSFIIGRVIRVLEGSVIVDIIDCNPCEEHTMIELGGRTAISKRRLEVL